MHGTENMGMTENQLVTLRIGHIRDIERPLFRSYFGIKYHMQQQVAQLFLDILHIVIEQRIDQFIGLFYGAATQRFKGLYPVPRALHPQLVHHVKQAPECLQTLIFVHNSSGLLIL